ncbi:11400_t:CDS:2 [Funneliformis mosseae]|uniref:11400_t:CDS:1 n=1 Tax=Funneliformis mosseae TaxID=27381 RepID=A0A9N9BX86_FUNMO|nr:11400_t:CDS:2 [Funneliformis mosseae]
MPYFFEDITNYVIQNLISDCTLGLKSHNSNIALLQPISSEGFCLPLVPVNPKGFHLPLVVVDEIASYRSDLRLSEKSDMAYVKQLKELISDKNFNAVKFYKNLNFPFARKKEVEKVLHESLKIITSENNVKVQKLLANFDKLINANSVRICDAEYNSDSSEESYSSLSIRLHQDHLQIFFLS